MDKVKVDPVIQEAKITNIIWILADIQYLLMKKNMADMKKKGMGLKQDAKHRFNLMMEAQKKAKYQYTRFLEDILQLKDNQLDQFYEDSNMIRSFILLIYEKLVGNPDNVQKAWQLLNELPAEPVFNWDELDNITPVINLDNLK